MLDFPEAGLGQKNFRPGANSVSVKVSNLTKLYSRSGKQQVKEKMNYIVANNDISFEIFKGEIFGLLGPNGAGKTTLVNQVLGLSRPNFGSINIEGIDVLTNPKPVRSLAAYLPQKGFGFWNLEVGRALVYTGQLRGLTKDQANHQSKQLLNRLDLKSVENRYVYKLSGGMQRMVGFAAVLMGNPKLLILDEPTNELDPARRRLVWETIREIKREHDVTCLLVTHNVLEAEIVLERLAVLLEGKLIALGTPGELKQQLSNEAQLTLKLKRNKEWKNPSAFDFLTQLISSEGLDKAIRIETDSNDPSQYKLFLPPEKSDKVLNLLIQKIGLSQIDDFKLSLPSLEDVYLQLTAQPSQEQDILELKDEK